MISIEKRRGSVGGAGAGAYESSAKVRRREVEGNSAE